MSDTSTHVNRSGLADAFGRLLARLTGRTMSPEPRKPSQRHATPAMIIQNGRVQIEAEQFEIVPGRADSLRDDPVKLLVHNAILRRENRYLRTEIATLRLRLEDRTYE